MTKKDFIDKYAEKRGITKVEAGAAVDAFTEVMEEALANGETVQFVGWGTFEVKTTAARVGRNPKTGAEITIAAKKAVKFKAGKKLVDKVNG